MATERVYPTGAIPQDPLRHKVIELLTQIYIPDIRTSGLENLYRLKNLISNGKKVILVGNHLSNADGPVLDQVLRRNGFEDIAQKALYVKGKKLDNNPLTEFLTHALPTIPVWPPSLEPRDEEEAKEANVINKQAFKIAKASLNSGFHIVLFPEAGRSRTGALARPVYQSSGYLSLANDTYIQTFALEGTERVLPIGETFPTRTSCSASFGRPTDAKVLQEVIMKELAKEETLKGNPQLQKQRLRELTIDYIMEDIAEMLSPEYRGVNKGLYEKVPYRIRP